MADFSPFFSLAQGCLALALALSSVLVVRHAHALAVGSQRMFRLGKVLWVLAAVATVSVLTIDGVRWMGHDRLSSLSPLPEILLLLAAMLLASLQVHVVGRSAPAVRLRQSPLAWCALMASLAMAGWSSYRLQAEFQPKHWDSVATASRPLHMVPELQYVGISDLGREIPLYRSASPAIEQPYHLENHAQQQDRKSTVIARVGPDASSNCHGWVFAGGEFLLDSQGLAIILEDNGYARCTTPQAGDVVVYFGSGDVPVHTGVVSGLLHDGTVIVESKWGIDGRYLHRPEDQPYSDSFAFFRSDRGGNEILIRELNSSLVKQRLPIPRRIRKA